MLLINFSHSEMARFASFTANAARTLADEGLVSPGCSIVEARNRLLDSRDFLAHLTRTGSSRIEALKRFHGGVSANLDEKQMPPFLGEVFAVFGKPEKFYPLMGNIVLTLNPFFGCEAGLMYRLFEGWNYALLNFLPPGIDTASAEIKENFFNGKEEAIAADFYPIVAAMGLYDAEEVDRLCQDQLLRAVKKLGSKAYRGKQVIAEMAHSIETVATNELQDPERRSEVLRRLAAKTSKLNPSGR